MGCHCLLWGSRHRTTNLCEFLQIQGVSSCAWLMPVSDPLLPRTWLRWGICQCFLGCFFFLKYHVQAPFLFHILYFRFWGQPPLPLIKNVFRWCFTSLMAQMVKRLPTMWETRVHPLGREDLLEKEMATHSSILARKIPWTEEPGRLQPIGSQESDMTDRLHFHFPWWDLKRSHLPKHFLLSFYLIHLHRLDIVERTWTLDSDRPG